MSDEPEVDQLMVVGQTGETGAKGEQGERGEAGVSSEVGMAALLEGVTQLTTAITSLSTSNGNLSTTMLASAKANTHRINLAVLLNLVSIVALVAVGIGFFQIHGAVNKVTRAVTAVHVTQKGNSALLQSNETLLQLVQNVTNPNSAYSKKEAQQLNELVVGLEGCIKSEALVIATAEINHTPIPTTPIPGCSTS
jgi:hypothetical protein